MAPPRSLILHRLTPYFAARIRQNQRLLSSSFFYSSSSSAAEEASSSSPSPSVDLDSVHMTDTCVQRMKQLQASEAEGKVLRLSVETGGCSGFQYVFDLDDKSHLDDRVFEKGGVKLVVDNISYDFVKGATVDYVEELIRSAFQLLVVSASDALRGSILFYYAIACMSVFGLELYDTEVTTNPSALLITCN